MFTLTFTLAIWAAGPAKIETPHDQNTVFVHVLEQGLAVGGQKITLPAPRLVDGAGADTERAALKEIATSDRALEDLFRDSVTAPFIIKVHDVKTAGALVRRADLYFAVYGDLKGIDPANEAARTNQKAIEVANMWFQTRILKPEEIRAAGVKVGETSAGKSWYAHIHARLLDRIDFETTNHVVGSESAESIVIASMTDPAFAGAGELSNGWKPLSKPGSTQGETLARQPYEGGISYAKISRVAFKPGALFVEMHVAFVEPDGWFHGAPILRSKFGVAAQDQIRTLRREVAKQRAK